MSGFTGIPKAVLEIIPKAACFWILVEGHSASRLCAAVCSLVPTGMLRAGNKSPHDRDGHAPFFCATKSNFEGTMVSFTVRSASHRPRNCSHASAAPAQRRACTKAAMWSPTRHLGHKKFHPPSSFPTCIHSYPASGFQFRVYHLSSGAGISIQSVGFFDRSALIHSLCKCNKPGQFGANNRQ